MSLSTKEEAPFRKMRRKTSSKKGYRKRAPGKYFRTTKTSLVIGITILHSRYILKNPRKDLMTRGHRVR